MLDMLIRGGRVVTPAQEGELDVAVQGEKIVAVAAPGHLQAEAARTIDARGKLVLPGGIEPHAHMARLVRERWAGRPGVLTQSPEGGTRSAAFGGTTTVVDFIGGIGPSNESILRGLEARRLQFSGSCLDYTFHAILAGPVAPEVVGEIHEAVQEGVASFKVFTSFEDRVPFGHLWAILQEVAKSGGIVAVHAEDEEIVAYMTQRLKRQGRDQAHNIHLVHNKLSEDVAFRTVIRLARATGAGLYMLHATAEEGVTAIAEARSQGQPVYGEALHHYLEFTAEDYARPGGMAIHTYPGLKYPADRDALLQGLASGALSTVATDDYTTSREIKLRGQTVETLCGGHNGMETRVPVAFTKLVAQKRVSVRRFVELTSTNAARILGLYPQKGCIAPGSDADIVILDPGLTKRLTLTDLHAESDYTIWEGFECQGYPVMTIARGKVIVEQGRFLGRPGDGRWLRRRIDPEVLARPVC